MQAGTLREKKQFHVKSETIDLCALDDGTGSFHPESFETTLGIGERKAGRQANERVKDLAALLASPRLAMADKTAI